jgi:hypothetical protein
MFFGQTESLDLKKYIKEEWVSLSQFYDKLRVEKELLLKGYGFFEREVIGQFVEHWGYHLVKINDRVFAFCGESFTQNSADESQPLSFKRIIEFDEKLLSSSLFEGSQYTGNKSNYNKFDAELNVEAKIYLYQEEEKLLISKKGEGNIDLYCSYQVKNNTNELICKVYPAAFTAAKHLAMNKILDQRIKQMKK